MEWIGHLSFGLIAASYLFRDIFWLRVLSVCASVAGIIYNYYAPPAPIWLVIGWNVAFLAVNAVWIGILIWERRNVRFNEDERELFETVFTGMSPVAFMKLLRIATWQTCDAGRVWACEGQPVTHVVLIYSGRARVLRGDRTLTELSDGQFVGEVSFLKEQPATASVVVSQPTRFLEWEKTRLRELLVRNPALHAPLEAILTSDLAEKLKRQRK